MLKLKSLISSLAVLGLASHAVAQTAPERITITGSSIKRIAAEGALPLQVITREEIAAEGISSAEQLMSRLAANGNGLDNMVSNQGGDFLNGTFNSGRRANNGAAAASLRGLGPQYTLVLLNGRRLATHGLNGQSVDLNSIPMAAIERIEILKDGASAIYGTDAIGGVINFILRNDYRGFEASLFTDQTQHGGGQISQGSITAGAGDLTNDRFNITASLGYKTNTRLRGSQRSFHDGVQPERGLVPDTTGTPYATIATGAGTALAAAFQLPGYPTVANGYNRVNPLALRGNCGSVDDMGAYVGAITGFPRNNVSCTYDYGRQWSMMQPMDSLNFVGKAQFMVLPEHTAFLEASASKTESAVEYTPIQLTTNAYRYPVGGPYYQDLAALFPTLFRRPTDAADGRPVFNSALPLLIRWRCMPCGPRQQDTTTQATRVLAGMEGVLGGWDYKFGIAVGQSKADTVYGDGNMYIDALSAALAGGQINPFLSPGQSQTAAGLAAIEGAKARGDTLYGGKANTRQVDATISRELFKLPAGPLGVAFGLDSRSEEFRFDNRQTGQRPVNGVTAPAKLDEVSRDITAAYTELQVPILKGLEAQLALRHDRYSDFGSTTNPKVGVRWQPLPELVLRGSYSRGFHAPDFGALYGAGSGGAFNSDINDPVLCPGGTSTDGLGTGCGIRPAITTFSNPNLKPERSKQFSFGVVVAPVPWLTATVDFWRIDVTDRISVLSGQALIQNYAQYQQYVQRDPVTRQITLVNAPYLNLAVDQTQGVDIGVDARFKTAIGTIGATFDGTYVDSYKTRFSANDAWNERVGQFGDGTYGYDLHLRWKHTVGVSLQQGAWKAGLSQVFSTGYNDEVNGYGSGVNLQQAGFQSKVKSYTLYNAYVTWTGIKNASVTVGIKNLLDTDPSFSLHNVDNVAGAGWDGRVGDPRGRSFTLRLNYKFF